jgi:hypothetical protein
MTDLIDSELLGEVVDAYLGWRDECDAVWEAADWCAHASASDASKAIAAYLTALDREEHAANVYADAITQITATSVYGGEALSAAEPVTFWRARWKR